MVAFVAQQVGVNPGALAEYGRRDTNRREHAVEAQRYLGLHPPVREDRRAALTEATASRPQMLVMPVATARVDVADSSNAALVSDSRPHDSGNHSAE